MKELKIFLLFCAAAVIGIMGMMGCEANYSSCTSFNALPHTDVMRSIGDSYIALSSSDCTNVTVYLGGMMGLHYNDYSVSADKIDDIIGEYGDHVQGVAGNPVTTLLMDGGGNDTLQGCTDAELPLCERTLNYAIDRAVGWIPSVYADGIEDIVWFGYPRISCGGDYGKFNTAVDYGMDMMMAQFPPLGVHMVDIRTAFADGVVGGPTNCDYLSSSDQMHPSAAGSYIIAELIYDVLAANNIPPVGTVGDDDDDDDDDDDCATVVSDKNRTHARAGRAYETSKTYYAVGSDDLLGGAKDVTALSEETTGYWIRVPACEM